MADGDITKDELKFAWDVAVKQYTRQVSLTGSESKEAKAAWKRANGRLDELCGLSQENDKSRKAAA